MNHRSRAKIATVLLALCLGISPAVGSADQLRYGQTIRNAVNVRKEASTQSEPIAKLKNGTFLRILDSVSQNGELWYKIKINDSQTGYIKGDLVELFEEAAATPSPEPTPVIAEADPQEEDEQNAGQAADEEWADSSSVDGVQYMLVFNGKERVGLYSGQWEDNTPNGEGEFTAIDKQSTLSYSGFFKDGVFCGEGYLEAEEITLDLYDSSNGHFTRTGSYLGDVFDGVPNGNGRFTTKNSQGVTWFYDGEWENGLQNGQGLQEWENGAREEGKFIQGEFAPTFSQALQGLSSIKSCSFSIHSNSLEIIDIYESNLFTPGKKGTPSSATIESDFSLPVFKKNPGQYGKKFLLLSGVHVEQVIYGFADYDVEMMILQDDDGNLYYGYHNGSSSIVENMRVSAYVLPLDYSTYQNTEDNSLWAMFCAITNNIEESYTPLQQGDKGTEVLEMKFRLQELGYFTAGAGLSDVYNGTCTERVKQFQANNGLAATGRADEKTLKKLYSPNAIHKQ